MNQHASENTNGSLLLTLKQTAQRLAISKRTLERLISGGQFPAPLKIGRSSRVTVDDVDEFLQRLRVQRPQQESSQ